MIAEIIAAATEQAEEKITIAGKPIGSRAMGGAERAGKKKQDAMDSILISLLSWRPARDPKSGGICYDVQFAAFCGSKNKTSDYTRSMIAASMAVQFTKLLEHQRWNLDVQSAVFDSAVERTRMVDAQSGLAIWEVRWWQQMPFLNDMDLAGLYLLQEVQGETDLHHSLDTVLEMESSTLPEHGNLQDP